jgi:hypothetical protein
MMLVKADKNYEQGAPPAPALMAAIGALGQEMFNSGAMLEMGGLAPTAAGALLNLVIGGYAVMQAKSKAEAIELARRFLQVHADVLGKSYKGQVEVRQLFDPPPQA